MVNLSPTMGEYREDIVNKKGLSINYPKLTTNWTINMEHTSLHRPESIFELWGTVKDIVPGQISIAGVSRFASLGNTIKIVKGEEVIQGEILSISEDNATALLFSPGTAICIGDKVHVEQNPRIKIGDHWLGNILNYQGEILGNTPAATNRQTTSRTLNAQPPPAHLRRALGPRTATGLMVTDTLLPICSGQRIGLFAGSGVGKSTLLGQLASGLKADRVVIALIGERSREVQLFATQTLTEAARSHSVVIASTASDPPSAKKRAAYCAMAAAEYFRDQGHSVLLIIDSLTRFAEAHRETALLAGETPALNAFPPSTTRVVAELAERAGTGIKGTGDITAIYSVLVAGSDMEEPVADMVRGILDGHIILSREIAERGRYPAVDVLQSVSRALPQAASDKENALLREYRLLVSRYEEVAPMLRANLYVFGQDLETDRAIRLHPKLDDFVSQLNQGSCDEAYQTLESILMPDVDPTQKGKT